MLPTIRPRISLSPLPMFCLLLGIISGIPGCGDPLSNESGILHIRITDAPFPHNFVRSVELTISKVEARPSQSLGFQTVDSESQTHDLLQLQGERTDTLGVHLVSSGSFDAVRLHLSGTSIELRDGRTFQPEISDSIVMHGLVVPLPTPVEVRPNQLTELVLDFDVPRSFIAEGDPSTLAGITGFTFSPAVRGVDLATVGQITGVMKHGNQTPGDTSDDIPIQDLPLSIVQAGTTDTVSVFTDDSGTYNAYFMQAGVYSVTASATDSTGAWSIPGVIVTTANPTRQDALVDAR